MGDDEPARRLQNLLHAQDVDTILGRDPKLYTCVKLRVIGRAQQLLRVDFEKPNHDHEVLGDMLADFERVVADHDAVLFSDYGKGGLTHILRMIEFARAAGKPRAGAIRKAVTTAGMSAATVITPNRAELAQVIGTGTERRNSTNAPKRFGRLMGLDGLLLTRSEEGMSLFDAAGHIQVQAQAREVFDVTGCGRHGHCDDGHHAGLWNESSRGHADSQSRWRASWWASLVPPRVTYDELFQ